MEKQKQSFGKLFMKNLFGNMKILTLSIPFLISTNLTTYWGKPINSQKELDSLVVSEAKKLGLDPKTISGKFGETPNPKDLPFKTNPHTAYVHQLDNGNYEIILDKIRTKNVLQHELYHIYEHQPTEKNTNYNFLVMLSNEIQANFYAATGVKTSIKHQ